MSQSRTINRWNRSECVSSVKSGLENRANIEHFPLPRPSFKGRRAHDLRSQMVRRQTINSI